MSDLLQALGWTVVHAGWQALLVWLVWRAVLGRMGSLRAQYIASCLALLCAAVLFGGTLLLFVSAAQVEPRLAGRLQELAPGLVQAVNAAPLSVGSSWSVAGALKLVGLAWLAVSVLLAVRTMGGWRIARRSFVARAVPARAAWRMAVRDLAQRGGLRVSPEVVESAVLDSPAVFGIMRPTIVLPTRGLERLSNDQLRGVLAHELEHVRRRDALANVLQCVVDAVLFFHPAIAAISRAVRAQRELICDVAGAASCGDSTSYVRGLIALEESRFSSGRLALAARGGSLLERARFLLATPSSSQHRWLRLSAALALTVALCGSLSLPPTLQAAAATATALTRYTIDALDPAGAFTLTIERGRAVAATIDRVVVPPQQIAQQGDLIVLRSNSSARFSVRINPRGGISWQPRSVTNPTF